MSRRGIGLVIILLSIGMTSCTMDTGTGDPIEISHNPKNLLFMEKSDYCFQDEKFT